MPTETHLQHPASVPNAIPGQFFPVKRKRKPLVNMAEIDRQAAEANREKGLEVSKPVEAVTGKEHDGTKYPEAEISQPEPQPREHVVRPRGGSAGANGVRAAKKAKKS